MSVRLSEFVAEAISEIAYGIHLAKADTYEIVAVVPGSMNGEQVTEKSYIEFDIAVTATSEKTESNKKSGKAGAGIAVLSAKVGADGSLETKKDIKDVSGTTSRIAFKVPVYFNAHLRDDPGAAGEADFVRSKAAARNSPSE
ncbi:hypothetical protein ACQKOH_04945 [Sphingomonas sp. NPDC092331]|jgi:hypothetical protein|uniref:hypothetical protein n=1 Tax=unclassified Sphingomonas TaxID=196159 RepID=UPI0029E91AE2|nr:hypothetical protein [Pseudomonadota bacterium]